MGILEQHQQRMLAGETGDQPGQGGDGVVLLALRRKVQGRIAFGGQRQHGRDQRRDLATILGALGQHGFELVELLIRIVVAGESGGALELVDERMEGGVGA